MLDFDSKIWLESRFKNSVRFDEFMSKHTSLRVGGAADAFVMPEKPEELVEIIRWCRQKDIPCLVIGDGTNLLVKDSGIRGIVMGADTLISHDNHKIDCDIKMLA